MQVVDQHRHRSVAPRVGLLLLVVLPVKLLLGVLRGGRWQLTARQLAGAPHLWRLLVAARLPRVARVQVHERLHLVTLRLRPHQPRHRWLLEPECEPVQLPPRQSETVVPLRLLVLPPVLLLLQGTSVTPEGRLVPLAERDAELLRVARVARTLLLLPLLPVGVPLKHPLVDPASCVRRFVAHRATTPGRAVLVRHARLWPVPLLLVMPLPFQWQNVNAKHRLLRLSWRVAVLAGAALAPPRPLFASLALLLEQVWEAVL